jgi:hypothetical protein
MESDCKKEGVAFCRPNRKSPPFYLTFTLRCYYFDHQMAPVGLLGGWEIGGKVSKVGFTFPTRER